MTYKEAKEQGYETYHYAWAKGYISRKTNVDSQPVCIAGGRRKGWLYVDVPSWESTNYHLRIYLYKPGVKNSFRGD